MSGIKKFKKDKIYKNCWNCKEMSYEHGDTGDSEGFVCRKKESWARFNQEIEEKMLSDMEGLNFLNKGKKCCDMIDLPMTGAYESWREVHG